MGSWNMLIKIIKSSSNIYKYMLLYTENGYKQYLYDGVLRDELDNKI